MKKVRLLFAAGSLVPSACSTPGGGPLGFVMFDSKQHVAAAEPLFGDGDERCLDDPTFLLTLFAQRQETMPADQKKVDVCTRMRWSLEWGLMSHAPITITKSPTGAPVVAATLATYDKKGRNEVLGAMMAASNRKCGRYMAFLQQYNGNVNAGFGIIEQAASALAAVATGGVNKGLTVTSVIAGHTRSELNEAHFANQTVGVLAQAFQNKRTSQATDINNHLQQDDVDKYTLMQGLSDVFDYHANCSIVIGLEQAQQAVSQQGQQGNTKTATTSTTTTATSSTTTATQQSPGGPTPPPAPPAPSVPQPPPPAPPPVVGAAASPAVVQTATDQPPLPPPPAPPSPAKSGPG